MVGNTADTSDIAGTPLFSQVKRELPEDQGLLNTPCCGGALSSNDATDCDLFQRNADAAVILHQRQGLNIRRKFFQETDQQVRERMLLKGPLRGNGKWEEPTL